MQEEMKEAANDLKKLKIDRLKAIEELTTKKKEWQKDKENALLNLRIERNNMIKNEELRAEHSDNPEKPMTKKLWEEKVKNELLKEKEDEINNWIETNEDKLLEVEHELKLLNIDIENDEYHLKILIATA